MLSRWLKEEKLHQKVLFSKASSLLRPTLSNFMELQFAYHNLNCPIRLKEITGDGLSK